MSKLTFNDEELRKAVLKAHDIWLESLPSPEECEQDISKDTQIRIEKLMKKTERRRMISIFAKRAAAVFAIILAALTTWLAVDTEARDSLFDRVRRVYNGHMYNSEVIIPEYGPTWLPDGLAVLEDAVWKDYRSCFLSNPNTPEFLVFMYRDVDTAADFDPMEKAGKDKFTYETVEINNYTADIYHSNSEHPSNYLIWTNEEIDVTFFIYGNFDKETLVKICESIEKVDQAK